MRMGPSFGEEAPGFAGRQKSSAATANTTTNAPIAQIALPGPRFGEAAGGGTTNDPLGTALRLVGDDASDSANATSFAVWNRFSRSFSRQWRTMWSSAGETLR